MAGKIIADIIEAPYDSIRMNVANVTVLTANSSGLTYVPTGNVNINIGGANANLTMNLLTANGIKFPATQVTSADGNTLDDYEEGTWSPSFSLDSGSASGVSSSGSYTKIGRKVTVTFVISFSSVSAAAINTITNFPFTVHNVTEQSVGSVRENSNTGFQWHIRANANQTTGIIRRYDNAQGLLDGHFFTGSVTYFTS